MNGHPVRGLGALPDERRLDMFAYLALVVPALPGDGVDEIFTAAQTELAASVPLILVGLAAILGLGWVIRAAFIAQKVAKKASGQIG